MIQASHLFKLLLSDTFTAWEFNQNVINELEKIWFHSKLYSYKSQFQSSNFSYS